MQHYSFEPIEPVAETEPVRVPAVAGVRFVAVDTPAVVPAVAVTTSPSTYYAHSQHSQFVAVSWLSLVSQLLVSVGLLLL